jgi:hypothetical protein
MTYNVILKDGSISRETAGAVSIHPSGALILGPDPQSFNVVYAPGEWVKIELSAIQNAN